MKKISEKEKLRILNLHENMPMKPWGFKLLNEGYSSVYTSINNREEGDNFRKWVYLVYPNVPNLYGLEKSSEYFHSNSMNNTWNHVDSKTNKSLGDLYLEVNKDRTSYNWDGASSKPATPRSSESSSANVTVPSYQWVYTSLFKAQQWWRDWLNNKNTKTKFIKINNLNLTDAYKKLKGYFKIINSIKLVIDTEKNNPRLKGTYAYVTCNYPNLININVDNLLELDESSRIGKIIHEIQHLLYCYYPLTPDKDVTQFKASDECYQKNKEIYDNTEITMYDTLVTLIGDNLDNIAKDLDLDSNSVLQKLKPLIRLAYSENSKGVGKDYFLRSADNPRNSEFQSILGEARLFLKIPPGGDITKEQIVNYIKNYPSTTHSSVNYILMNWIFKEFPPLDEYIKDLNTKFVKTDNTNIKQKSPFDLPYKPGEGIV